MYSDLPKYVQRRIRRRLADLARLIEDEPKRLPRRLLGDLSRSSFAEMSRDERLAVVRAWLIANEREKLRARKAIGEATTERAPAGDSEPSLQRFRPGEVVRPCACRCGLFLPVSSSDAYIPGHAPKLRPRRNDATSKPNILDVPSVIGTK